MSKAKVPTLRSSVPTARVHTAPPPPKEVDPFYNSPEYLKWRGYVINRARGVCEWPGCDRAESKMYADHILERRDRPDLELDPNNGQCLCASHHTHKTQLERAKRMAD